MDLKKLEKGNWLYRSHFLQKNHSHLMLRKVLQNLLEMKWEKDLTLSTTFRTSSKSKKRHCIFFFLKNKFCFQWTFKLTKKMIFSLVLKKTYSDRTGATTWSSNSLNLEIQAGDNGNHNSNYAAKQIPPPPHPHLKSLHTFHLWGFYLIFQKHWHWR